MRTSSARSQLARRWGRAIAFQAVTLLVAALAITWSGAATARGVQAHPAAARADAGKELDGGLDAAPDAAETAAPLDPDELRRRIDDLIRRRDALRVLNGGSLPDGVYTTDLFPIDLHDEAAVTRLTDELAKTLVGRRISPRPSVVDAGDGGAAIVPDDAGTDELQRAVDDLDAEVERLELTFLRKPASARAALLGAEADAQHQAAERAAALTAEQEAENQRVEAEAAQRQALAEAEQAQEAGRRAIANERARAEGVRAAQARRLGDLSKHRSELARTSATHAKRDFELQQQAQSVATGTPEADSLYDQVVAEVKIARGDLSRALDTLRAPDPAPRFRPDVPVDRADLVESQKAIDQLAIDLARSADGIERDEGSLAWDRASESAERAKALNDTRLALLEKVSADKRARTLGLGDEGREQFFREVQHLTLLARWTWISQGPDLRRSIASLKSPAVAAVAILRLLVFVLLVGVARSIARRAPEWAEGLKPVAKRAVRVPVLARALYRFLSVVSALAGGLVFLGFLLLSPTVIGPSAESPFFSVPHNILVDYAIYRMAIQAAHRSIGWFIRTPLGAVAEGLSARVLRSLHLVGRFAFGLDVFLTACASVLGRGYLYNLALRVGWFGALPVAAVLIASWRTDIVQAYLKKRPSGAVAEAVRRSRDHWYGFFVATFAFVVVLVGWIALAARRFVLSFDQTRKALAYLFRKRLEREAGERAAHVDVALPEEVAGCLRRSPVTDEGFVIDRYPALERWVSDLATWRSREDRAGTWLVVGKSGFGKTSWLNAAVKRTDLPVVRLRLTRHLRAIPDLVQVLADEVLGAGALGAEPTPTRLVEALLAGPRRVIVIDDLQNLVLRSVGHLDVWAAFSEILEHTARHVYWLCSSGHFSYEFLRWARRGQDAFRTVVELPAWSEKEIRELLEARTRASGWHIAYDDLVTARADQDEHRDHLVSTAQEYTRLIWGYSEGSPRVAVQCWADSLVPSTDRTLRVRLFRRPLEAELDQLEESHRFVLASVVWHENVALPDVVESLRLPSSTCEIALTRLTEIGVLVRAKDARYRVTSEWWSAVVRYLRRKHLIES